MDLSRDINYRGLDLNDAELVAGARLLRGLAVEEADYSAVEAVGYTEKRAEADGLHASDVYLGPRLIEMRGLIYAATAPEMFDRLRLLRVVFSPTSAYQEDPVNKGFLPLRFHQPTEDKQSFPSGVIDLFIRARPRALPRFRIVRDRTIGVAGKPQTMGWTVGLLAKDPRVYVDPQQVLDIAAAGSPTAKPGRAVNRGDYESPLNILLVIGNVAPVAGSYFRLQGFGVDMRIQIEPKANVVYRWRGNDRTLMVQDARDPNSPEALRMDLVTFQGRARKPMVPAKINPASRPFTSDFTYTCTTTLAAGSRLFWNEAFA
jgi:hypothetical protein